MNQTGDQRFKRLVAVSIIGVFAVSGFGVYGFAGQPAEQNNVKPVTQHDNPSAEVVEIARKKQLAELEAAEVRKRDALAAQEAAELQRKQANAELERLERLALESKQGK